MKFTRNIKWPSDLYEQFGGYLDDAEEQIVDDLTYLRKEEGESSTFNFEATYDTFKLFFWITDDEGQTQSQKINLPINNRKNLFSQDNVGTRIIPQEYFDELNEIDSQNMKLEFEHFRERQINEMKANSHILGVLLAHAFLNFWNEAFADLGSEIKAYYTVESTGLKIDLMKEGNLTRAEISGRFKQK